MLSSSSSQNCTLEQKLLQLAIHNDDANLDEFADEEEVTGGCEQIYTMSSAALRAPKLHPEWVATSAGQVHIEFTFGLLGP